jgi:Spy/CpxP family protein refolding chaperone
MEKTMKSMQEDRSKLVIGKLAPFMCLLFFMAAPVAHAGQLVTNSPMLIAQADDEGQLTQRQMLRQRRLQMMEQMKAQGNNENNQLPNDNDQANGKPSNARQKANASNNGRSGNQAAKGPFGGPLDLSVLNLTEEQKQQIRQMRQQDAPKARAVKQILRAKRIELRDLMFDPTATDAQIHAARKELRKEQEQLEDLQFSDFLKLRGLLTTEQKMQLPDVRPAKAKAQANNKPEAQLPKPPEPEN